MFANILSCPVAPGDAPFLPHLCAKTVDLGVSPDPQTAVTNILRGELPLLPLTVPSSQFVEEEEKHLLPARCVPPPGSSPTSVLQTCQEVLSSSAGRDLLPGQGWDQDSQHHQPYHGQRVNGECEDWLLVLTFIITQRHSLLLFITRFLTINR